MFFLLLIFLHIGITLGSSSQLHVSGLTALQPQGCISILQLPF